MTEETYELIAKAKAEERERCIALLNSIHLISRQDAHIQKPSFVCKTCRAISLIQIMED
jgi:hypothetical protein